MRDNYFIYNLHSYFYNCPFSQWTHNTIDLLCSYLFIYTSIIFLKCYLIALALRFLWVFVFFLTRILFKPVFWHVGKNYTNNISKITTSQKWKTIMINETQRRRDTDYTPIIDKYIHDNGYHATLFIKLFSETVLINIIQNIKVALTWI